MSTITIPNFFAVWRPAINLNPTENQEFRDIKTIIARTVVVAFVSFAFLIKMPSVVLLNRFTFYATFFAPFLWYCFEDYRVKRAADQLLINFFKLGDVVPLEVMNRFLKKPELVRKLCNTPDIELGKIDTNGEDLFSRVIKKDEYLSAVEKEKNFLIFKMLVTKGGSHFHTVSLDDFSTLIRNKKTEFITYLLERDLFPKDITPKEMLRLWFLVKDDRLARLLVSKGFDINIKVDGKTPLMRAIEEVIIHGSYDASTLIPLLIRNKAEIPSLNSPLPQELGLEQKQNEQQHTLSEVLEKKKNPEILTYLQQAETKKLDGESQWSTLEVVKTHLLNFSKPSITVSNGSFEANDLDIGMRTMIVAIPLIFILPFALVFGAPLLLLAATPFIYNKYEWSRTVKALNALAVKELKVNIPLNSVTRYVFENESALNSIDDLNPLQLDSNGKSLWTLLITSNPLHSYRWGKVPLSIRLKTFEKIATISFQKTDDSQKKFQYLLDAIKSDQPEYVDLILQKKWILPDQLTEDQHFECWTNLQNKKTAAFLKNAGFKIDAKNQKGHTPLAHLLNGYKYLSLRIYHNSFRPYDYIDALLNAGAEIPDAEGDILKSEAVPAHIRKLLQNVQLERIK